MNWYIGQEVVCVKTHKDGLCIKGKIYTIKGLQSAKCGCESPVSIDVGAKLAKNRVSGCLICRTVYSENTAWLDESRFAPIMDISELKEILNEEIQRV